MNIDRLKIKVDIQATQFKIQFPENYHFVLSSDDKLELEVNNELSNDLHSKMLELIDKMYLNITMTQQELDYQTWLINSAESIVKQRIQLASNNEAVKLKAIKKYLEIIEYELQPKKIKKQIKQAQKPIKKPSKRWYQKT
jgi:hypothetical protein